jgi:hypothetical protein
MTEEAYAPEKRRAALLALQERYPALFPSVHAAPGLDKYAVKPGDAMEISSSKYFAAVDENKFESLVDMWPQAPVSYLASFLETLFDLAWWRKKQQQQQEKPIAPTIVQDTTNLLTAGMTVEKQLTYADSSINAMVLYAVTFKDPDLIALADGRNRGVVKSQTFVLESPLKAGTVNNSLFEFTNEVIVSRLLNALVTAFKHTATPHFTTFLGCFKSDGSDDTAIGKGQMRVFAVYERANRSFYDLLEGGNLEVDHLACLLFQVIFSLAVANFTLGYSHNDLHCGNVMVRDVDGTRYQDRCWAYKMRKDATFKYIDAAFHHNQMVEIIDEGRATLTAKEPESPGCSNRLRFAYDVEHLLRHTLKEYTHKNSFSDRERDVLRTLRKVRDCLPNKNKKPIVREYPPRAEVAHAFYTLWHTDDPTYGLGPAFEAFLNTRKQGRPLVVAIAPNDTILTVNEPMAADLPRIWGIQQGMKRAAFSCRTCLAPAAYATENQTHFFCGRDCYHVFYGAMEVA